MTIEGNGALDVQGSARAERSILGADAYFEKPVLPANGAMFAATSMAMALVGPAMTWLELPKAAATMVPTTAVYRP